MKTILKLFLVLVLVSIILVGCATDADVVSQNISKDADQFAVYRRVVFYNGITDKYILQIEGYCSLGNYDAPGEVTVTCKTGEKAYVKHFLGLSDNVTYFAEQIQDAEVSSARYKVIFKPSAIIPDVDIR